jgi:hypothetical protein
MEVAESKRQRDVEQAKRVKERKKALLKALNEEPKVLVKVKNLDFLNMGVPVQFNYEGIRYFDIPDGSEQELPVSVIEHINKITVPESIWEDPDPETGQRRHRIYHRNRFSAIPVNMQSLIGGASEASSPRKGGGRKNDEQA